MSRSLTKRRNKLSFPKNILRLHANFFDVNTFFYPGTGSADSIQHSLLATMDGKGACVIWNSDSVNIPTSIVKIGDVIGGHGPVGPGG